MRSIYFFWHARVLGTYFCDVEKRFVTRFHNAGHGCRDFGAVS